jgi:hypothetical protein
VKDPLGRALRSIGMDAVDVAARLSVDPKTVRRWLTGRLPYPRHRAALVELTGWTVRDLWPSLAEPMADAHEDEVRVAYAHRSAVPADAWHGLFERAELAIDVLAYSALFLAEDAATQKVLRDKARAGVKIRMALGDPDGSRVAQRGSDEGIETVMPSRIRNALHLFRPLAAEPGIELRLHDTVLYTSIYRGDEEILVNPHVYGCPASHAPVLLMRRATDDGMVATYLRSFERVWASTRAVR